MDLVKMSDRDTIIDMAMSLAADEVAEIVAGHKDRSEKLRRALHEAVTQREIAWNTLDELATPGSWTVEALQKLARAGRDASAESAR